MPAETEPRLVLLYVNCTLNRSFLGPYDSGVTFTPNIDGFAREGTVFKNHHSESGVSGPCFASNISGTQAPKHRVYYHPRKLPDELHLLAESYRDAGYDTHFWSGHPMAAARLGYGQGVPARNVVLSDSKQHRAVLDRNAQPDRTQLTANDARFEAILKRLEADPSYKAYVQVFFTITHAPYHNLFSDAEFASFREEYPEVVGDLTQADLDRFFPLYSEHRFGLEWNFPETIEKLGLSKTDVARLVRLLEMCYRIGVHKLDGWFGRVLAKIHDHGLDSESLVALTTDHGEILYRENALFHWVHGKQLAPEVIRIPWIIRGPGVPRRTYEALTRSIDLHPTLLGLSGLQALDSVDGVDLSASIRGLESPPELRALSHTTVISDVRYRKIPGLNLRNSYFPASDPRTIWVLIRDGALAFRWRSTKGTAWKFEAFDWDLDPGETRDIFDPRDPRHARVQEELVRYKELLISRYPGAPTEGDLSEDEMLEALRALGYVR